MTNAELKNSWGSGSVVAEMGHRCCGKHKVKRGLWSPEEDDKLIKHVTTHGHGSWSSVPKNAGILCLLSLRVFSCVDYTCYWAHCWIYLLAAGLERCGKSCRLRWINYLRPELKRGSFTSEEEQIIIDVHRILGNRYVISYRNSSFFIWS